uniref:Uncharacterized protein n=1 Tax=Anabas testudineus TaxID=64144 RepID=A0A7N6BBM9_ANATE
MNPVIYPAEAVQIQMGRYDGFPGQPERPPVVQNTTVNIIPDPPQDHIIWSMFWFVDINPCCLGLAALIHSIKVIFLWLC